MLSRVSVPCDAIHSIFTVFYSIYQKCRDVFFRIFEKRPFEGATHRSTAAGAPHIWPNWAMLSRVSIPSECIHSIFTVFYSIYQKCRDVFFRIFEKSSVKRMVWPRPSWEGATLPRQPFFASRDFGISVYAAYNSFGNNENISVEKYTRGSWEDFASVWITFSGDQVIPYLGYKLYPLP